MTLIPLLLCLLLCGCAAEAPPAETTLPEAIPPVLQEAKEGLEHTYGHDLDCFPLDIPKVQGIRATPQGILVFSGYGSTTLTLMDTDSLQPKASTTLAWEMNAGDPSLQFWEDGFSIFDPVSREMVMLDFSLQETRRIAFPKDMLGSPLFSEDRRILYYPAANAILAWDLESGIHRRIKELSCPEKTLVGLHCSGTILQCRIMKGEKVRTLFLSSDTGQLIREIDGDVDLTTDGNTFYTVLPGSSGLSLVFGTQGQTPRELYPQLPSDSCIYLPQLDAAITVASAGHGCQMDIYLLNAGTLAASLTLEAYHTPSHIQSDESGNICFLLYDPEYDCSVICRWNPSHLTDGFSFQSAANFTDAYYTADAPNRSALAQCQALADQIGQKHGIRILVWQDAADAQPWDYILEPEHRPRIIQKELQLLDQQLSTYPEGFLEETASHFSGLTFCLVRSISGSPASGSLDTATGIQFFEENEAYLAIAAGKYAGQALHHELFHIIETHILSHSNAFDHWDSLNPAGFSYDYSYATNAGRDSGVYLTGEQRAFVDTYSMSYPKEDRARIMEYAILPGNQRLFQSKTMQKKLLTLCQGIREAYHLEDSPETFLWEQYLE